jgi:membrane-bound lytic murein transglycosylase B
MAWADATAQDQGWDASELRALLGFAQRQASVIRLVKPAAQAQAKNWAAYRARFVEPQRIAAGLAFWEQHQDALERAEKAFGVPAWLVVGIIGVETLYGRHTGQYRVLDALATLAFDFPSEHPRAAQRSLFFQQELLAFVQLSRASNTPVTSWLGSYAGALGLPQFMPSSWQRHAVDFDGDGRIDLRGSPADAIGSVARYMQAYGWVAGLPTHLPVNVPADTPQLDALLQPDIVPTFSPEHLLAQGLLWDTTTPLSGPLALVKLENAGNAPTYVLGTRNFYTVTRYNWSSYYALAVIELGQAVAERMGR